MHEVYFMPRALSMLIIRGLYPHEYQKIFPRFLGSNYVAPRDRAISPREWIQICPSPWLEENVSKRLLPRSAVIVVTELAERGHMGYALRGKAVGALARKMQWREVR